MFDKYASIFIYYFMAKHYPRYVEIRIKGQNFTFNVRGIRYRDSKGHYSKFTTKKKLSVEVIGERLVVDKKKYKEVLAPVVLQKYSLPLRKRKRPITKESTIKRIRRTLQKEKRSIFEATIDGVVKFTYLYRPRKRKKSKRKK